LSSESNVNRGWAFVEIERTEEFIPEPFYVIPLDDDSLLVCDALETGQDYTIVTLDE